MKVRVEQLNPIVGAISENRTSILQSYQRARQDGIDLLIVPEMVLTGYPAEDLLENRTFRRHCYQSNEEIISSTSETALLFGSLTENPSAFGRKMFNSALLCRNGELLGKADKLLLPTYDIFDDLRYFEPARQVECLEIDGYRLGVTICEDIWYNQNQVQYHFYDRNPAKELKEQGAAAIVNISASPYNRGKHAGRLEMLRYHTKQLGLPIFYSNQTGGQSDVVFDGDSLVMDANGEVVAATTPFEPDWADVEWDPESGQITAAGPVKEVDQDEDHRLFLAIQRGVRDYIRKSGLSEQIVIGLSGGIDSALTTCLAAEAVGVEQVTALTLPSDLSSSGSVEHSRQQAEQMGLRIEQINIQELFSLYRSTLGPYFGDSSFGIAEENLQSRIRGALLMAWSNKFDSLLLTTGNKSELAVGYATLYGDMNGGLNPIGDLYKTQVYQLSRWLNDHYYQRKVIPEAVLSKAPSAELRPEQKDSDSLPEYKILDEILIRYLEGGMDADEIISETGMDGRVVRNILNRVDRNEFKRFQAPPVLRLTVKSFGSGRRWPLVQGWSGNRP